MKLLNLFLACLLVSFACHAQVPSVGQKNGSRSSIEGCKGWYEPDSGLIVPTRNAKKSAAGIQFNKPGRFWYDRYSEMDPDSSFYGWDGNNEVRFYTTKDSNEIKALAAAGSVGPQGPAGADGTDGVDGTDGATWYSNTGVPSSGLGNDGDHYFRTTTGDIYLKSSGAWAIVANITGPQGPAGATGATGATGPQGPPGNDGADGTNGTNGTNGIDGTDGVDGATWYSGSGAPSGGTGVDGDFYFRTSTSDVYTKVAGSWGSPVVNLTGPTGATGATGAAGPNNVTTSTTTNINGVLVGDGVNVGTRALVNADISASAAIAYTKLNLAAAIQATTDLNATGTPSAFTFLSGDNTWKAPFTFSTTGSSGAATFSAGALNIPNYTLAGLGGTTDHTALSNLSWASSGHTGTASNLAGWNGSNVAAVYGLSGTGTTIPTTTGPTFTNPVVGTQTAGDNSTKAASTAYVDGSYAALSGATFTGAVIIPKLSVNNQTGTSYTLVLTDAGKWVTSNNGSAVTFTVPLNSSVAFPVDTYITFANYGAGAVTISPTGGVTINGTDANRKFVQYAEGYIHKTATDTWIIGGKTTP